MVLVHKQKVSRDLSPNWTSRKSLLNLLMRKFVICQEDDLDIYLKVPESILEKMQYSENIIENSLTRNKVASIINGFLAQIHHFHEFYQQYTIQWPHKLEALFRKSRIVLHKLYKIAPVFDYPRARQNLHTLQQILSRIFFWPQIFTQLAVTIYITDKNAKNHLYAPPLSQKNIRALTQCSAYAFHRTRRKISKISGLEI